MDDLQIKADSLSSHSSRSEGYTISAIVPSVGYFFSRKSMKNGEPTADTRFFNLKAAKTGPLGGRALAAVSKVHYLPVCAKTGPPDGRTNGVGSAP